MALPLVIWVAYAQLGVDLEMAESYYSAPWDDLARVVTIGVFVLIGLLIAVFLFVVESLPVVVGILILYCGVLAIPFLWAPRGYVVRMNVVSVKRLIGDARMFISEPPRRWSWTWWGIRLFGSGGLYGYYGYFALRGLGKVLMYATNRHNLVLLNDRDGRRYLVSPDNPEEFMEKVQA